MYTVVVINAQGFFSTQTTQKGWSRTEIDLKRKYSQKEKVPYFFF